MDAQSLWLIALSVATPIAGIVGFSVQLRQVKKTKLENEKLQLEIMALKAAAASSQKRIVLPTNEEVMRITRPGSPMFSRSGGLNERPTPARQNTKDRMIEVAILVAIGFVVTHAAFDIYRFVMWLADALSSAS